MNKYIYKHCFLNSNHILVTSSRLYHGLSLWDVNLNTDTKISIEKHWKAEVAKPCDDGYRKDAVYILSMFPYPSGNLHLGHARVYSISDTISRFYKMNEKNVLHPMGWDAFGLPAENAALERKIPPKDWTQSNITAMKNQLHQLGFNFNWEREIATCDPDYYKWTQYIFLKLYEHGLAYKSKAMVNWDPVDATVLADEQVDSEGRSWRSGAKVEKKLLSQWFVKTTKFSKPLYDGLSDSSLENWRDITNLQKHWIGECNGLNVRFKVKSSKHIPCDSIDVWSSDLKKFISPAFITVSSSNILAVALQEHCIGSKLPITCVNPLTDEELPVYVSDSIEYPEGRDIYLAGPFCSEADNQLSQTLCFPEKCLQESSHRKDVTINEILNKIKDMDCAEYPVSSKLRDWLVSRQRYWGTPIPIINCPDCGIVPVPYSELPVRLPDFDSSRQNQNLVENEEWINCSCPQCNSVAKRETDTLDTFVDSSWYFLRYLDPKNCNLPFDKEKVKALMPVDLYIGGKEHAVLHLYYARFMNYFLHHIGWVPHPEPFKKLLVQGMIMGKSYKTKSSGKYLPVEKVEEKGGKYFERETMEAVSVQWEKMSKSKYNGENPQSLISKYGCDTTRLFLLADVAPSSSRNWSDATFPGVLNWQHRLWLTIREFIQHRSAEELTNCKTTNEEFLSIENKLRETRNYLVAAITFCLRHTYQISVAITRLQSLTNTLRNKVPAAVVARSPEYEAALSALVIMLAPLAPHFSSELWAGMRSARRLPGSPEGSNRVDWAKNALDQTWPVVDENYHLIVTCKVDGAERGRITLPRDEFNQLTLEEALSMALKLESVSKRIERLMITKTDFDHYQGCRATLNIHTNIHSKKEKVAKEESN